MATVQGDFKSRAGAESAKKGLIDGGISDGRIRMWNIIPEAPHESEGDTAQVKAMAAGGLLAGAAGIGVGAAAGALYEGIYDEKPDLPDPVGVRVVVDISGDEEQLAVLLAKVGAINVKAVHAG